MMRAYNPVPVGCGQFNDHYAIREDGTRRLLCAEMRLSWDQADRLCDIFDGVRQRALNLDLPRQRSDAA
jgi:hypothetical protein